MRTIIYKCQIHTQFNDILLCVVIKTDRFYIIIIILKVPLNF